MNVDPPAPRRFDLLATSVLRRIREGLAAEREAAAARVSAVLPVLEASMTRLRAAGAVGEAWLFGSFAEGTPTASSDIALVVDGDLERVAERIEDALGLQVDAHALHTAPPSLVAKARAVGTRR